MKTTLVSEWKDNYGNRATIEEVNIKAHKDAKQETAYRLSCYAEYNEDFCYYVSVFETVAYAEQKLVEFSCGTFKDQLIVKAENIIETLSKEDMRFINDKKSLIKSFKNNEYIKEEKKSLLITSVKKLTKEYINNLINRFIIDYDEAKILYEYIEK